MKGVVHHSTFSMLGSTCHSEETQTPGSCALPRTDRGKRRLNARAKVRTAKPRPATQTPHCVYFPEDKEQKETHKGRAHRTRVATGEGFASVLDSVPRSTHWTPAVSEVDYGKMCGYDRARHSDLDACFVAYRWKTRQWEPNTAGITNRQYLEARREEMKKYGTEYRKTMKGHKYRRVYCRTLKPHQRPPVDPVDLRDVGPFFGSATARRARSQRTTRAAPSYERDMPRPLQGGDAGSGSATKSTVVHPEEATVLLASDHSLGGAPPSHGPSSSASVLSAGHGLPAQSPGLYSTASFASTASSLPAALSPIIQQRAQIGGADGGQWAFGEPQDDIRRLWAEPPIFAPFDAFPDAAALDIPPALFA